MGVKSTEYLTRGEAEELLLHFQNRLTNESPMSDTELEDELERLNDLYFRKEYNGDSGFSNYIVQ